MIFLRCFEGLAQNGPPFSGEMCPNRDTIVHFEASRNSEPDPPDSPDPPDPVLNGGRPGRTDPGFHAQEQDDGS